MLWKIIMVLGILGVLLGLAVVAVSIALPMIDTKVSWDEALFGIIPGTVVLIFSLLFAVLGLFFVIRNRRRPPQV